MTARQSLYVHVFMAVVAALWGGTAGAATAFPATGQTTVHRADGRFWNKLNKVEKLVYVNGFLDGAWYSRYERNGVAGPHRGA